MKRLYPVKINFKKRTDLPLKAYKKQKTIATKQNSAFVKDNKVFSEDSETFFFFLRKPWTKHKTRGKKELPLNDEEIAEELNFFYKNTVSNLEIK